MKIIQAGELWLDYHRFNSQKNSVKSYEALISKFYQDFGERSIESVTTDEILGFRTKLPKGKNNKPNESNMPTSRPSSTSSGAMSIQISAIPVTTRC